MIIYQKRHLSSTLPAVWALPTEIVEFLGDIGLGLFFFVFPGGRFVPHWTRWLMVAWIVYWLVSIFFSQSPLANSWLSLGFAVLRYRLWDMDVLVNRTLVYGTLTILLGLIYAGLVIGFQALLRGLIAQTNDIAIVASTLAIAALFQPLRSAASSG